jgi:hypothetical protein
MAKKTPKICILVSPGLKVGDSGLISPNWGVYQGVILVAKIIIPNYQKDVSTDISFLDSDGDQLYVFSYLERNKIYVVTDLQIPLVSREILRANLSDSPGGIVASEIFVTFYYEADYK